MFRTIIKDSREFLANPRSALLMLVWPCIVLWAIAPLPDPTVDFSVYVDSAGPAERNYPASLAARLNDLPDMKVVNIEGRPADIWSFMDEHGLDAAIIWHESLGLSQKLPPTMEAGGAWYAYVQPRSQYVARKLEFALQNAHISSILEEEADPDYQVTDSPTVGMLWTARDYLAVSPSIIQDTVESARPGAIAPQLYMMERNGPAPLTVTQWLTPRIMVVIATMITFIYAANSLVRERSAATLHLILSPPNTTAVFSLLGKVIFPAVIGFVAFVIMLLFAQSVLGYIIQPNWLGPLGFQALALLVVALQGLSISALSRTNFAAIIAATGYFVVLMLFSDLFFKIGAEISLAKFIGWLTPVTFVYDPWADWLNLGIGMRAFEQNAPAIGIIGIVSFVAALASIERFRRSI